MSKSFQIRGIEDTKKLLNIIAYDKSRNLARAANLGVASQVGKKIRELAPEEHGHLKKSIKWRAKRVVNKNKPESTVFVGNYKGNAKPFYWRFLEYGRGGDSPMSAINFVRRSIEMVRPEIKKIYLEQFNKKLASLIKREQKKAAK